MLVWRNLIEDNAEKINNLKEVKGKGLLRHSMAKEGSVRPFLYIRELPRPIKKPSAVSPLPLAPFGTLVWYAFVSQNVKKIYVF